VTPGVNRDASLSLSGPGSGPSGQRGAAARAGSPGSAGLPPVDCPAAPALRSRQRSSADHGHSGRRSPPGPGSQHIGTAAPSPPRPRHRRKAAVDGRLRPRNTVAACVPSTVWGHGIGRVRQIRAGAVLAPILASTLAAVATYPMASRRQAQPSNRQDTPHRRDSADPSAAAAAIPGQSAPELRGFRPTPFRVFFTWISLLCIGSTFRRDGLFPQYPRLGREHSAVR
jgi:hypothetical protein